MTIFVKKMLADAYDFTLAELRNFIVHKLSGDPGSPLEGQLWYNTTSHGLKFYNGTDSVELGSSEASGTVTSVAVATANGFAGTVDDPTGDADISVKLNFTSGLVKAGSGGAVSAAVSATDYAPATTGSSALKASSGGFATATINDLGAQTADYSASSHKFTNVADPVSAQDAATMNWVLNLVNGLAWKDAVRVATSAAGTLASSFANGQTVDGIALVTGDRILIKNQSTGSENGIYTVNASGAPTRATDADSQTDLLQATVTVEQGTVNADTTWTMTNDGTITVGTTALVFVLSGTGSVAQATSSAAGKVQLASQSETEARTDTAKAVVPADLVNFPRKYSTTIGDGTTTDITVIDGLGTKLKTFSIQDATTGDVPDCGVTLTSTGAVFSFSTAPTTNAYTIVLIG